MRWFVLCSGPSLTGADIERVRLERDAGRGKVIAVNSTIFHAPWADVLYANDQKWWNEYYGKVIDLPCRKVARNPANNRPGIEIVKAQGDTSGHQAISWAYSQGASEIVTLGWDCTHADGVTHHHGGHPEPMKSASDPERWIPDAGRLAHDLKEAGVPLTNCSPLTALKCFPVMTLERYLGD